MLERIYSSDIFLLTPVSFFFCQSAGDGTSHTTLEFQDYRVPGVRYIEWDKLWTHQQNLASSAGWTKTSWNAPGKTENLEKQKFDDLPQATQDALRELGFYTRGMYDCVSRYSHCRTASKCNKRVNFLT
jgi:hypothetical protein